LQLHLNHDEEMPKIRGRSRPCIATFAEPHLEANSTVALSFAMSLRDFSHSYRLVCGIGDRCSTVSRERYRQCTSPTKSSNCVTNRGHALPSAQPLRMLRLFVTQRSMLLTRQPASISHSLWSICLMLLSTQRMPMHLPVLQLTENSTSQLAG
jgi:hypothetical protein